MLKGAESKEHIMGKMKLDNHIDPDLFDLFISEQVYLRYAEEYLDADQIDEIDVAKIPGYTPMVIWIRTCLAVLP